MGEKKENVENKVNDLKTTLARKATIGCRKVLTMLLIGDSFAELAAAGDQSDNRVSGEAASPVSIAGSCGS